MRATILASVLATAALLTVAGCSTSTPGNASTSTAGASTTGSGGNGDTTEHGAPRVKSPLDYARFEAAPCSALTSAQLQALAMPGKEGKDDSSPVGQGCSWRDTEGASGQSIGITFVKGGGGLDYLYLMKDTYELFKPIPPVQGYPAILESSVDSRTRGYCGLVVGITDQMGLSIDVQVRGGATPAPRYADPCGVARDAADQVMITLKGGS